MSLNYDSMMASTTNSQDNSMSPLAHVQVVLARPSEPRNIGAVCRALKNFGITRLAIVAPQRPDLDTARPLAVSAVDILDSARITANLEEAVSGSALVAGITRRVGQKRKLTSFAPWELAEMANNLAGETLSVVFGNEQSGLSDQELECCQIAVSIPTAPIQPSLNLSHAVQLITYELYKSARRSAPRRTHVPLAIEEVAKTVERITGSLEAIGFHSQPGPQGTPSFLTDLLARASVSPAEAKRLEAIFQKIEGMSKSRKTTPSSENSNAPPPL